MIKKTVGQNYKTDESDVLQIKIALKQRGFYDVPAYGLTPYADKALFDGIKKFQAVAGLNPTGIVRPNDKTVKALSRNEDEWTDDGEEEFDDPSARPPVIRCTECGAPHGGSMGDLCPPCHVKQ